MNIARLEQPKTWRERIGEVASAINAVFEADGSVKDINCFITLTYLARHDKLTTNYVAEAMKNLILHQIWENQNATGQKYSHWLDSETYSKHKRIDESWKADANSDAINEAEDGDATHFPMIHELTRGHIYPSVAMYEVVSVLHTHAKTEPDKLMATLRQSDCTTSRIAQLLKPQYPNITTADVRKKLDTLARRAGFGPDSRTPPGHTIVPEPRINETMPDTYLEVANYPGRTELLRFASTPKEQLVAQHASDGCDDYQIVGRTNFRITEVKSIIIGLMRRGAIEIWQEKHPNKVAK
jgi:hypothetical protein